MARFQPDWPKGTAFLVRACTFLVVLLIVLALFALIGNILGFLDHFRTELYMFVLGALLAYLIAPAVRILKRIVRKQWAAILGAYLLLFAAAVLFGFLLLAPFVSQTQSLVKHMQNPSASSLVRLQQIQRDLQRVQSDLGTQQRQYAAGNPIPLQDVQRSMAMIDGLSGQVAILTTAEVRPGDARIPPSYANPIVTAVSQLDAAYGQVAAHADQLAAAVAAAGRAATLTHTAYQKAASTPMLLLNLQTVLDQHNVQVDLHDRFGQLLQSLNDQVSLLLNNALSISVQAGSLLLDTVLVFIISIYFISDGPRFIRWLILLVPAESRQQATTAAAGLSDVLGSYLRTQVVLALLAGISDATGCIVLGIPYPVVIFFSSFLLSLVPVLGPVLLPFPPLVVSLIFTPLPRPVVFLIWLLVGEQLVTNVVGPRLQAHNLRIHPLEAMAAALAGLPLAGLPGAFFAVPCVAFVHIVIREVIVARRATAAEAAKQPPSTAQPPRNQQDLPAEIRAR